jgi:hypothetical protein
MEGQVIVPSSHLAIVRSEKRFRQAVLAGVLFLSGMMMVAQMAPSHEPTQPPAQSASPHGQMGVTQSGNPHGTGKSTLKRFAAECGVTDMSESQVEIFAAKADGKWRSLPSNAEGESTDVNAARAWKDQAGSIRVVDMSRTNAAGDVLQMSRMCFSPKGSLRKVAERYVNIPSCACGRSTDTAFDEQGKQTKFEQSWYKVPSQEKIGADALKNAPKVILYKSVSALPFANLLKEKNASSH